MNRFHITNYKIYNDKVLNDYRIVIISDIHYNHSTKMTKLNKLLKKIKELSPNYIFIPGDFLDYEDVFYDKNKFLNIKMWLKQLTFIAPVFIALGNHEHYKMDITKEYNNFIDDYTKELNKIKGVHFLNNKTFIDDNISITGFTLSKDYYSVDEDSIKQCREDKSILYDELRLLNKHIKNDKTKLNFLLVHSPLHISDKNIRNETKQYDYIISGHMHNGCVPPIIYEIWRSTRGFISPDKRIISKNSRNTLNKKQDKLLVNGPITTFSKQTFILKILNLLFPMYISTLDFTGDKKYDSEKIYRKCKYEK